MTKLVYVAEPIDQSGGSRWSEPLIGACHDSGFTAFVPKTAFAVGGGPDPRLEEINRAALSRADALVAILPAGVPSIGVPREIEAFARSGKPWAVLTDAHSYSLFDASVSFPLDRADLAAKWLEGLPEIDWVSGPTKRLLFAKDGGYDGQLPTRAHPGDAGLDLYAAERVIVPYDKFVDVPCGVRVALPPGTWARIVGRSSTLRRRALLVAEGTIDEGYRGPLFAGVRNLDGRGVIVEKGERLAQLILMHNLAPEYSPQWASAAEFDAIPHDGRGEAGFGSTGA